MQHGHDDNRDAPQTVLKGSTGEKEASSVLVSKRELSLPRGFGKGGPNGWVPKAGMVAAVAARGCEQLLGRSEEGFRELRG